MAAIEPFRAIAYNAETIGDLSAVLTPPYDVITPESQQFLHERHPNNFVRLDLGLERPTDDGSDNRYTRAAGTFEGWLEQRALVRDDAPSIYVYEQTYSLFGKSFTRRSMVSLVRLEPYGAGTIYPHELTHSGPKADRLNLLRASQAQFSLIFSLYDDENCTVNDILEAGRGATPSIEFDETDGGSGSIWRVSELSAISAIQECMRELPLYIADGHHRYETSLNYWAESQDQGLDIPGAGYIAMACVSMSDPGLTILPTHRAIRIPERTSRSEFLSKLRERFALSPCQDLADLIRSLGEVGGNPKVGMFCPTSGFQVLELKAGVDLGAAIEAEFSERWHSLEVSVLHCQILRSCAGIPEDQLFGKGPIHYSHEAAECLRLVNEQDYDLAFFLNPLDLGDLKDVVRQGEKMPPKSTFFYPKLMSGVLVYDLRQR